MARIPAWVTWLSRAGMEGFILLPAALLGVIFWLDLLQPAEIVLSMLYVMPIVLTVAAGRPRVTYVVFTLSSVATVAAAAFGTPAIHPTAAFLNRGLSLMAQVLAAAVVIQQLELSERQLVVSEEQARLLRQARQVSRQAAEGLSRLQSAVTALPEGLLILDRSGTVIEANSAAARILGTAPHTLLDRKLAECLPAEASQRPGEALPAEWPGTGPAWLEAEYVLPRAGMNSPGRYLLTATIAREPGEQGAGLVLLRDITRQHEEARQQHEFISMATHELRAPLSTLRGYVQLAQSTAARGRAGDVEAVLGKTLRQADRLNRLIGELLIASHLQSGHVELQMTAVDLVAVVHDAVEQQRMVAPHRTVLLEAPDGPLTVRGDAARLEQVLSNLLDNAIKYSPDGGTIRVAAQAIGQWASVAVTDEGVGIPAAEQGRLFERFYRVRSSAGRFSGLGVGLYISNRIVEEHDGRMSVQSLPGQGSTFAFVLPCRAEAHPAASQA